MCSEMDNQVAYLQLDPKCNILKKQNKRAGEMMRGSCEREAVREDKSEGEVDVGGA